MASFRYFPSPGAFAAYLGVALARMPADRRRALDQATALLQQEAQRSLGTYQAAAGPFRAWAPLADSTVDDKTRLGYAPPDNPLLRTGQMRDSIQRNFDSDEGVVGSDYDVAFWQELGTVNMPPRSFLGSAAARNARRISQILGAGAVASLIDDHQPTIGIPLP